VADVTDLVIETPPAPTSARFAADVVGVDLMEPKAFIPAVPHDAFAELRRHGGIAWHTEPPAAGTMGDSALLQFLDGPGFWAVTSHELVSLVDRDQELFSSELGGTTIQSLTAESLLLFRQMMLNLDHPRHSRLRKILQPAFTNRSVGQLHESIVRNAREILDDPALAGQEIDLVEKVSAEMPLRVLADLFGMPREDRHLMFEWSNALLGAENPDAAQHAQESAMALAGMMAYGLAMAEDRRKDPRDDIISRIVNAEVDGERLDDSEFSMFWLLLVVAGNETTRNAVTGSVVALHEHGQWGWLREHPEHMPSAINELLRYVSPVQQFRRTATRDVTLGDQDVRAGDKVVIWFGAANRDPAVFADPDRLDLLRDPNPHVAFGVGPHHCLGAHLARMEMAEMLKALLERAPNMTVGEPVRVASNFINGIAHLPVRLDG
jgi:cytochrome P450